jgi:hypothetical protein
VAVRDDASGVADRPVSLACAGASPHHHNINRLAQAGIVGGKGDGRYDPDGAVTRGAMTAFLTRAYDFRAEQSGDTSLPAGGDYFTDDAGHTQEVAINRAAAVGFAGGAGDGTYRPDLGVRPDQMGSFLARVLDLIVENGMAGVPAGPADPGDTKNCGDFSRWRDAQDWFERYYPAYGDVARLDGDNDRVACESLPGAP